MGDKEVYAGTSVLSVLAMKFLREGICDRFTLGLSLGIRSCLKAKAGVYGSPHSQKFLILAR